MLYRDLFNHTSKFLHILFVTLFNMTYRSSRDSEYVLVQEPKPKKSTRYYYDADDDSQSGSTTGRVIQTKPSDVS